MDRSKSERIKEIFRHRDVHGMQHFIKNAPSFPLRENALMLIQAGALETPVMILDIMSSAYTAGRDMESLEIGLATSMAGYELAKELHVNPNISDISRETILLTVGSCAVSQLKCLLQLGEESFNKLHLFARQAFDWLTAKGDNSNAAAILVMQMEAYLNAHDFENFNTLNIQIQQSKQADLNVADNLRYLGLVNKYEKESNVTNLADTTEDLQESRKKELRALINGFRTLLGQVDEVDNTGLELLNLLEARLENEPDQPIDLDNLNLVMTLYTKFLNGQEIDIQEALNAHRNPENDDDDD